MPNWCEGSLKVRGNVDALKAFIFEGLQPVTFLGDNNAPLPKDDCDELHLFIQNKGNTLWMKNTRRHFCEPDYIEVAFESKDDIQVLIMPMKAACHIEAEALLSLCKEFKVDMKIQGFEQGMQFSQLIEIIDGEIIKDEELKYPDWDWDCPCPRMGG